MRRLNVGARCVVPALILLAATVAGPTVPLRAETHEIFPNHHSRNLTAGKEPILRIKSGDTVVTRTWDSGGGDQKGIHHLKHPYQRPEGGNPLFGPFYVEGRSRAMRWK